MDRLPPQNLEAERGVLGAWLLDNATIDECSAILCPEDFYRDSHQILARTIMDLRGRCSQVDAVTLADELTRLDLFRGLGGDDYLCEIANSVPHAANARYHAEIVKDKAITRSLIQTGTELVRDGYSNLYRSSELLESAEQKIFAVANRGTSSVTHSIREILDATMRILDSRNENTVQGIPTPFGDLNRLIDGFSDEELILIGGRPSQGKTSVAMQIAAWVTLNHNKRALVFSLEMNEIALAMRMLSSWANIDSGKLKKPWTLGVDELRRLGLARHGLENARLHINDASDITMHQIAAECRRMRASLGLDLVVIDYLQLIKVTKDDGDNRQEQVATTGKRLKNLARELSVPVICLCQLNRQNEARDDKRPRLSDLRESGSLEQEADMVIFVHRPEYYDRNDSPGVAELIVAKNRNGPTGTATLTFVNSCTRFDNMPGDELVPPENPDEAACEPLPATDCFERRRVYVTDDYEEPAQPAVF